MVVMATGRLDREAAGVASGTHSVRLVGFISFIGFVLLAMFIARGVVYSFSARGGADIGLWQLDAGCSAWCIGNPDSPRYLSLTQYFAATDLFSINPLRALDSGVDYEGAFLGASKNGVGYSYVAALLANALHVSPTVACSVVSFGSAVLIGVTLRRIFHRHDLSPGWLLAAAISPIVTFYGNQVMKETLDALLLLILVDIADKRLTRRRRRWWSDLLLGIPVAVLLYFDREYYLYVAMGMAGMFFFVRVQHAGARLVIGVLATSALSWLVLVRGRYTFGPLTEYYTEYGENGGGFGSLRDLVLGTPRTLLAPVGGLDDPSQIVLFLLCIPVFACYVAWFALAIRHRRARAENPQPFGLFDPYFLAFFTMTVGWTVTYGGGFERGRDSVAPLLFIAVARWDRALRGADRPRQGLKRPSRVTDPAAASPRGSR